MGLNFEFATASRIIFGKNSIEKLPVIIAESGKTILIVTGRNSERIKPIVDLLHQNKLEFVVFNVHSEPTLEIINKGVELARKLKCDVIIGIGGGSVIDSAKAIAALAPNTGQLLDYLEVIGKGETLTKPPIPCIAIPTTSGTGAEVTMNSVIKSVGHSTKVSLRSNLMYPKVALVDPLLTVSMPPELSASTGVDALTHLLETFVSNQSNPFIDMFCREGMKRISGSLNQVFYNGNDIAARENMSLASMFGGIALANVKLGAVHGFAGPIGGMFPVPHGAVCASLLPAVLEINIKVVSDNRMELYMNKFDELAKILTNKPNAKAEDSIDWVQNLISGLKIPSLSNFGITEKDFQELVQKAKQASSMKGNPVLLGDNHLFTILEKSL